ncbi:MAG: hypothetical protein RID53_00340 [Coleofasciculus sp. B1-GNL1-01]|uniref:hypothetical protein n=1 Tax=Coleofasciculus sp. B1-GNL1-01 TaxID=3068484 RepID=UPI0032FCFAAF
MRHWSLVIGHWSLVIGHWSLVIWLLCFNLLMLMIFCTNANNLKVQLEWALTDLYKRTLIIDVNLS